jgi:hypothetical protein
MEFFAFVAVIFGIVTTIIWLVIGWRAMRAHERIADTASEWMLQTRSDRLASRQKSNQPRPQKKNPAILKIPSNPPKAEQAADGDAEEAP